MQHNNKKQVLDLVCDERETPKVNTSLVVICPCCEQGRRYYDFWYFVGKKKQQSKICSYCYKELRQLDKYLARILDGVKIPTYETPIIKYSISCCPTSQS